MVTTEPIKGNELGKIFFFIAIQLAYCLFFCWGIIPALILLGGYFLSIRDKNILLFKKSQRFCNLYIFLTMLIVVSITFFAVFSTPYDHWDYFFLGATFFIGFFLYYLAVKLLLVNPIENNFDKILCHGLILSKKTKKDVLNQDNNKHYSVSEELMRLANLKDKGVISDSEFLELKDKILSKK